MVAVLGCVGEIGTWVWALSWWVGASCDAVPRFESSSGRSLLVGGGWHVLLWAGYVVRQGLVWLSLCLLELGPV